MQMLKNAGGAQLWHCRPRDQVFVDRHAPRFTLPGMIALIRKLFWFALFVVFTFGFVVIFEHGVQDFATNAQMEWQDLQKFFGKIERPKDKSDKIGQ